MIFAIDVVGVRCPSLVSVSLVYSSEDDAAAVVVVTG